MKRIAICCCGKASIVVKGEPELHGVCHCHNCQKRTGSAFGISAYFNTDNVLSKKGDFGCYSFHSVQNKSFQERYFCNVCGTTLFWRLSTYPHLTGVAGGCFAEYPLSEPTYATSCKSKFSWVRLPWRWRKLA